MKTQKRKELIASYHKPELALKSGMIWQIWEDGELTLQKSGELLWQRTLHSIVGGFPFTIGNENMPVKFDCHSYAFIESEAVGNIIREEMIRYNQELFSWNSNL